MLRPGGALDSQTGSQQWLENEIGPIASDSSPAEPSQAPAAQSAKPIGPSSPTASEEEEDPNDFFHPNHEFQTQITRANHHFRQASFIYHTLLHNHQRLEQECATLRQWHEEHKHCGGPTFAALQHARDEEALAASALEIQDLKLWREEHLEYVADLKANYQKVLDELAAAQAFIASMRARPAGVDA
jgi:hypothetical protein